MKTKEEFKNLITSLTDDEFIQLEQNCIEEGIREPIITWNDFIIDGHNRFEIANKHNLEFKQSEKYFSSENAVCVWIINNQFGRRNLSPYTRSKLAITKNEYELKIKAKNNQGARTDLLPTLAESSEDLFDSIKPIDTRKELAKLANVSHGTLDKVKVIEKLASLEVKEKLEKGEATINEVYSSIKKEELQEKQKQEKQQSIEKSKQLPKIENVICGDSRIETLNIKDKIKCVITDPPFGCDFISNRRQVSIKDEGILNDCDLETALNLTKEVYTNLYNNMEDNSYLFSFIRWKEERYFMEMIENIGFTIRNSIIWVKNNHGSGDLTGSFSPKHERIIFAVKGNPKLNFRPDDVLEGKELITDHPTSKPIDLIKVLIEATTNEGDVIYDPFAGHGSIGIAAKQLKRSYWLCELDEYNYSQIKINLNKYE